MAIFSPLKKNGKNLKCYNLAMTANQRDYLADLAGSKGIRLEDTENVSVAWASKKIEELKSLPDAKFDEATPELDAELDARIVEINGEVNKWTLVG